MDENRKQDRKYLVLISEVSISSSPDVVLIVVLIRFIKLAYLYWLSPHSLFIRYVTSSSTSNVPESESAGDPQDWSISFGRLNGINRTSHYRRITHAKFTYIMTPEESQEVAYAGLVIFWNTCNLIFCCGLTGIIVP